MEELLNFTSSQVVFSEGDDASGLYIIQSGEVLCLKNSKERLIPVYMAKAGDIIGESSLLSDAPHIYSAIALSTASIVKIPNKAFLGALTDAPSWIQDLTRTMISRFENTSNLIATNRIFNDSILSEESYTPALENEYKRLLSSKV